MLHVEITAPARDARLSSPLAIACIRYEGVTSRTLTLRVGEVRHVLELDGPTGEVRENITLLVGKNTLVAEVDGARHEHVVHLKRSKNLKIAKPSGRGAHNTRAEEFSGTFTDTSCPAGVIAVNGFMQQFAVLEASGDFGEMVVLRPGVNHLAVQIGEFYATRKITTTFPASKLLTTLLWDTNRTDVDLYVTEPSGKTVFFRQKEHAGTLDVDRTQGFGPENYSIGGDDAAPGTYTVRVHYYASRGVGRTEWAVRILGDEGTGAQRRRTFYGILEHADSGTAGGGGSGPAWNDVCVVTVGSDGSVSFEPEGSRHG